MNCGPCSDLARGYGKSVSFQSPLLANAGTHIFEFDCSNIGSHHHNKGWLLDIGFIQVGAPAECTISATIFARNLHRGFAPLRDWTGVNISSNTQRIFVPYPNIEIHVTCADGGGGGSVIVNAAGAFYDLKNYPIAGVKKYLYSFTPIALDGMGGSGPIGIPPGADAWNITSANQANGAAIVTLTGFAPLPIAQFTLAADDRQQWGRWYEFVNSETRLLTLAGGALENWNVAFRYDLWT